MRQSIVSALMIVFVLLLLLSPACDCSFPGLLPLAGVGLVGFKLYLGMQLLGGSALLLRHLPPVAFVEDDDDDDPTPTTQRPLRVHKRAVSPTSRNAFPRLNPEILKFIHQIDDDQCFEKFFCQLGAERKAFGSFGMNVALMLEFYISDRNAWFAKAMENGRKLHKKELCPGRCESEDIRKVVNYVSKQLFSGY